VLMGLRCGLSYNPQVKDFECHYIQLYPPPLFSSSAYLPFLSSAHQLLSSDLQHDSLYWIAVGFTSTIDYLFRPSPNLHKTC
jgi:hypothetical protein